MTYTTKVSNQGNSLGIRIPGDLLRALGLALGDAVAMQVRGSRIKIARADDTYTRAMALGKECATRYGKALAKLAK